MFPSTSRMILDCSPPFISQTVAEFYHSRYGIHNINSESVRGYLIINVIDKSSLQSNNYLEYIKGMKADGSVQDISNIPSGGGTIPVSDYDFIACYADSLTEISVS